MRKLVLRECRALLIGHSALLRECRALFRECRALSIGHGALLRECRALGLYAAPPVYEGFVVRDCEALSRECRALSRECRLSWENIGLFVFDRLSGVSMRCRLCMRGL